MKVAQRFSAGLGVTLNAKAREAGDRIRYRTANDSERIKEKSSQIN